MDEPSKEQELSLTTADTTQDQSKSVLIKNHKPENTCDEMCEDEDTFNGDKKYDEDNTKAMVSFTKRVSIFLKTK